MIESRLARLSVALLSVLCCMAAIEMLSRFYLWHIASEAEFKRLASIRQIKDRYGDNVFVESIDKRNLSWSPHYFLDYFPTPGYQHGENIHNSYGFRGDEFSLAKAETVFRIVTIGGSTTYSIDVQDYKDSYPYLLESYLHEEGFESIEVLNAGVAGYTSHHNLINLQFRVLPLQPDLIVIYQGFNDIGTRLVYPYSRYLGDASGSFVGHTRDIFMPSIFEYSTFLRIIGINRASIKSHGALDWHYRAAADSNVGGEFNTQFQFDYYPSGIFEENPLDSILENNPPIYFERNLRSMLATAESQNVRILLVTMVLDKDFHEKSGSIRNRFYASDEYAGALAEHNEVTRKVAAQTGALLLDMARSFPDDESLSTDSLHFNRDGNRVRAQIIGDYIVAKFFDKMREVVAD